MQGLLPFPLLLFLLIAAAIFQSNGHGDPVSGFLYVPALTAGATSFIRPPCRFRKKQEPDRIYLAAGICGNMPPRRLEQLKFSLLITACSWLP